MPWVILQRKLTRKGLFSEHDVYFQRVGSTDHQLDVHPHGTSILTLENICTDTHRARTDCTGGEIFTHVSSRVHPCSAFGFLSLCSSWLPPCKGLPSDLTLFLSLWLPSSLVLVPPSLSGVLFQPSLSSTCLALAGSMSSPSPSSASLPSPPPSSPLSPSSSATFYLSSHSFLSFAPL